MIKANHIVLPDGYHLDNFQLLVDHALTVYSDLLTPEETDWIQNFLALPIAAQSLFVRLIMRKGPYFRTDSLSYDDVSDLPKTLEQLEKAAFIDITPNAAIDDILRLCLKKELQTIAKASTEIGPKLSKSELIDALKNTFSDKDLTSKITDSFTWFERCHDDIVKRLQLLFFGNGRQGLTEFITNQLGIIKYESYPIGAEFRFFQSRKRLTLLEQLTIIIEWRDSELSDADIETIQKALDKLINIKSECLGDTYIERKANRAITQITRQLERLSPELALKYYLNSDYPPSRERQARILVQQNNFDMALGLITKIEANPKHPDEFDKLKPLKKKVLKALGQTAANQGQQESYLEKHLTLPQCSDNIEQIVANHLTTQENECFHLENQLFLGLFGLFFWDIIFAPSKDAFFNAYQLGPRDIWDESFYHKRKQAIDQRLPELIKPEQWHERIQYTAKQKQGLANYFVNWQIMDETLITKLCNHLNGEHLVPIFQQMLSNLGYFRNGFPDLLLLTPDGYQLWEVKGPTDSLQSNQKRWLSFFQDHDIPAGIIYVQWRHA